MDSHTPHPFSRFVLAQGGDKFELSAKCEPPAEAFAQPCDHEGKPVGQRLTGYFIAPEGTTHLEILIPMNVHIQSTTLQRALDR